MPRCFALALGATAFFAVSLGVLPACSPENPQTAPDTSVADVNVEGGESAAAEATVPRGLHLATEEVAPGYVLYSPLKSGTTYLIDGDAQVVHTWQSEYAPHSLYLLADGRLLRPGRDPDAEAIKSGGAMGILQMFSWDGELIWEWKLSDHQRILHHDVEPLPNGNLLAIGWELRTPEQAQAVGRRAELIPEGGLWPDFLLEIEPLPPHDARIVWEWRVWDHLIQNVDPSLPNHARPGDRPERIDINAGGAPREIEPEELAQLKALGYVPDDAEEDEQWGDFIHINAIDWNADLDQIAVTAPELGEIWILARPSSSAEAAGSAGDLLYRWGNPEMYGNGQASDRRLFYPHDVQWIPPDFDNTGRLTLFNNGGERPEGDYSSIEEIAPPLAGDGSYTRGSGAAWGPVEAAWTYTAPDRESFYAPYISGTHRLRNGNTFVTSGPTGLLFEVATDGRIVWKFANPYTGNVTQSDGSPPWGEAEDYEEDDETRYGVFRAQKISPDHPGLSGRDLRPLDPQPPVGGEL
jgi:hypothetical protein